MLVHKVVRGALVWWLFGGAALIRKHHSAVSYHPAEPPQSPPFPISIYPHLLVHMGCAAHPFVLQDNGAAAATTGHLYKVVIPVHRNRSIESTAVLLSANNTMLLSFPVRLHGYDCWCDRGWPDFNNSV